MNDAKILLISSNKDIAGDLSREWNLKEGIIYKIGRKNDAQTDIDTASVPSLNSQVAEEWIDLSFDLGISRSHCKIWFEEAFRWSIKDTSTYGTKINGEKIPKGERVRLKFDDEISLGNKTTLIFIPAARECCFFKDFFMEIEAANSLNYALVHNGLRFVEKIKLYYGGGDISQSLKLNLKLENYFDKTYEIPVLSNGESFILKPDFRIEPQTLENQNEASASFLKIFIGGVPVMEKEVRVLAYNEWSKENNSYHRTSLASFVLPNHPYVEQIVSEVRDGQDPPGHFPESIYNYFKTQWKIEYTDEPLSFEHINQRIRLPHQILFDWSSRKGAGTCIDLVLLFAACLEKAGFNPWIFICQIENNLYHAIAGWQKEAYVEDEPLIDKSSACILNYIERLPESVRILDFTSFTKNIIFEKLLEENNRILNYSCVYAINVGAARRYNILPLPFCGQPKESPAVTKVDKKAKELAKDMGKDTGYRVYSPAHILLALFMAGDGFTREIFKKAGIDIEKSKITLTEGLKKIKPAKQIDGLKPSEHYRAVWALAQDLAKKEGSPFIFEKHLFLALLETESEALTKAIISLGTNRDSLRKWTHSLLKTQPFFEGEKSFFGSIGMTE
ncbi:MAG: Clp protease N-terminal domain-containing protein [Candidatus Omnitrophota bacterium]